MITTPTQSVNAIASTLKSKCGVSAGSHILVAVSGGPDSVALLRALAHLAPRRRWNLKLTVAHVHHNLRPCADEDARFTKSLASQLELPYIQSDIHPAKQPGNLEATSRQARYRALTMIAHQISADYIATGHHADDQLETLIMRFLRGSSTLGLSAIPWVRPLTKHSTVTLIRPMLHLTRSAILDDLTNLNQTYRTDPTNTDTSLLRNRIRHQLLPTVLEISSHAPQRASELATLAKQHHQLLQHTVVTAQQEVSQQYGSMTLNRNYARSLPADGLVLSELLRRLLIDAGVSPDTLSYMTLTQVTTTIRDHTGGQRRFAFSNHVYLEITRDTVTIAASHSKDTQPMAEAVKSPSASSRA